MAYLEGFEALCREEAYGPVHTPEVRFGVDSEYGRLRTILMAGPEQLKAVSCNSVTREMMRNGTAPCPTLATIQHSALVRTLKDEDVSVIRLACSGDLPDLCFTRDTTIATPWGLIGAAPGAPHRRDEVDYILEGATNVGIPVAGRVTRGRIEGGDVMALRPGLLLIGVSGDRTTAEGVEALSEIYESHGWQVLVHHFDPHFLHLDTQLCLIDDGLAVACVDVLDDAFLATLSRLGIRLIPATYKELRRLGCNLLSLGDRRVVTAKTAPRLDALLTGLGYRVIPIDLSEFVKCGGGVHCLTQPIARDVA